MFLVTEMLRGRRDCCYFHLWLGHAWRILLLLATTTELKREDVSGRVMIIESAAERWGYHPLEDEKFDVNSCK